MGDGSCLKKGFFRENVVKNYYIGCSIKKGPCLRD